MLPNDEKHLSALPERYEKPLSRLLALVAEIPAGPHRKRSQFRSVPLIRPDTSAAPIATQSHPVTEGARDAKCYALAASPVPAARSLAAPPDFSPPLTAVPCEFRPPAFWLRSALGQARHADHARCAVVLRP